MKDETDDFILHPSSFPIEVCMRYRPTFEEFVELAKGHSVVPVYRQLIGDTLTPVTAFCKIQEGDWAFLFESVVNGERLGRFSFQEKVMSRSEFRDDAITFGCRGCGFRRSIGLRRNGRGGRGCLRESQ